MTLFSGIYVGVKFSFGTAKNLGEGRGHFVRN
jgi:hypothetical protein